MIRDSGLLFLGRPVVPRYAQARKWRNTVSGSASAVKEPGDFEVRKSSIQVRLPGAPDAAKGSSK